jgi:hypothetical protein
MLKIAVFAPTPKSQGKHRYDGKTGTLQEQSQSVSHILK